MGEEITIVEAYVDGVLKTGVALETGKKLKVKFQGGSEKHISRTQIVHEIKRKSEDRISPDEIAQKRLKLADEIDLRSLWEYCTELGITETSISELAKIWFGKTSASGDEEPALIKALSRHENIFFKLQRGVVKVYTPQQVHNLESQVKKQKEWQALVDEFLRSLKREEKPGEKFSPIVQLLIEYASKGEVKSGDKTHTLLRALGITSPGKAKNFLVERGFIREDENLSLIRYQVKTEFPSTLKKLSSELDLSEREEEPVQPVTIDPEETETYDDAVWVELSEGGFSAKVFIADPTCLREFPDKGKDIAEEAVKRGQTAYMPDLKIDMLPEGVRDALSLKAGEVKGAIEVSFSFRGNEIEDAEIKRVKVNVQENLSYSTFHHPLISQLIKAGELLEKWRLEKGGFMMMRESLEIKLDSQTGEILLRKVEVTPLAKAIAELMNVTAHFMAKYAVENGIPFLFRKLLLRESPPEDPSLRDFSDPLVFHRLTSMVSQNLTSLTPGPHQLVGLEPYGWGTSPIRRSADLINIAQISTHLKSGKAVFEKSEVEKFLGAYEDARARVSAVSSERYFFYLARAISESWEDKILDAITIEHRSKDTVYYVKELCHFAYGPPNTSDAPGEEVKVKVFVDRKRMKLRCQKV